MEILWTHTNEEDDEGYYHILPVEDIAPHGRFFDEGDYELVGTSCSCNPKVEVNDAGMYVVSHNCFAHIKMIRESMNNIGL